MDSEKLIQKIKKQNLNLRDKLKKIEEKHDRIRAFLNNMMLTNICFTDKEKGIVDCTFISTLVVDTEKDLVNFLGEVCDTPVNLDNIKDLIEEE